jgi:hypothetical protein
MRTLLVVVLALGLAGVASAAVEYGLYPGEKVPVQQPEGSFEYNRQGGDTIAECVAVTIPSTSYGTTCGYINDYDEACPYTGSTAPDVVYCLIPDYDMCVAVDLCNSLYDTKVYMYDADLNLVDCNDDAGCGYSGYQSLIEPAVVGGALYYIVVDGYGGDCGDYQMDLYEVECPQPCILECPEGALDEGEGCPYDEYDDTYNGGCNADIPVFQPLEAQESGCATLCGLYGVYAFQGFTYRDTDFYEIVMLEGTATFENMGEYNTQSIIMIPPCDPFTYVDYRQVAPCELASMSWDTFAGEIYWLWMGTTDWDGPMCADYILWICGIEGGTTPTVESSWGSIKNMYK